MNVLVVGTGFYGSIMAYLYKKLGHNVKVVEKRHHLGGNSYTSEQKGIHVHEYGPHIFHTNNEDVWDWVNRFAQFNNFTLRPFTLYNGELYSLPFNMLTFNKLWSVTTPDQAKAKIEEQKFKGKVTNLEEQAKALVGNDVYEKLIKGYTIKQWKKDPKNLPASIIRRLPVRFTYDNNYFNDKFQGIPVGGYTQIFQKLLSDIDVSLKTDFFEMETAEYDKIIYTGPIDKYFGYVHGKLEYRSLEWKHKTEYTDNLQGIAMLNRADLSVPYTRTIEHKHFDNASSENGFTILTEEYPADYIEGKNEPLYPVNDELNNQLYLKYKKLALQQEKVVFGGRLATYKYYDMHQVIAKALSDFSRIELDGKIESSMRL